MASSKEITPRSSAADSAGQSSPKPGRSSAQSRARRTHAGSQQSPPQKTSKKTVAKKSSTETPNPKTATPSQSTATQPPAGPNGCPIYSTSKLAELYDLNRATVAARLKEHKIKPVDSGPRKADYELTPEVESALEGNTRLDELEARKRELDIELKQTKLGQATGRLVEFDKAADTFTKVAKGLFDRFIQYSTKAGPRLHKCKNGREVSLALRRDFEKIFGELRGDFRRFIK